MNAQEAVVYSVYVGIDWADTKHDVCIQSRNSDERVFDVIRHRAEAIDTWVKDLHQQYGGHIAVAVTTLESSTKLNPEDDRAFVFLAAAYGYLERKVDAISAVDSVNRLRSKNRWGNLTIEEINRWRWTGDRKRLKEGLALAGVESGYEWYSRMITSGNNVEIRGATVIGTEQAKQLHEAGVPFIDISYLYVQARIPGAHNLRWGRDNEMGPREFNEIRLMEIASKSGEMVTYHPNGSIERYAGLAAAYAVEHGFQKVYYFRDGLEGWQAAGYPVESRN